MLPIGSRRRSPFSLMQLAKYYRSGEFTDFTLNLSDESSMRIHRVILASSSEFFSRGFQSGFREVQEQTMEIKEDPFLFRIIIEACYGIKSSNLEFSQKLEIYRILNRYQFYLLMDQVYIDLSEMEVPPASFQEYVETIEMLYDELTPDLIDLLSRKIRPGTDLSNCSELFLEQLFSRDQFTRGFSDELEIFWLIHNLVKEGHSKRLYRFVKFGNIDSEVKSLLMISGDITQEMLEIRTRRLGLTEDLVEYLGEQKKKALLVRINRELEDENEYYCFGVTGDGDQTEVILASLTRLYLNRGDLVKITNYTVRNTSDRILVVVSDWIRLN